MILITGVPEETGSKTLSGCIPAEAGPENHQIPAHAEGTTALSRPIFLFLLLPENLQHICHNINRRHHNVIGLHWHRPNFSSVTSYLCNAIHVAGEPWLIITCPLPSPSLRFQAELWSPVFVKFRNVFPEATVPDHLPQKGHYCGPKCMWTLYFTVLKLD